DDGRAVLVRRGQLEPHRLDPGAGRTAEAHVSVEGGLESLAEDQPERDVETEDQRDRGRERRVESLLRLPRAFPVEVEARRRGLASLRECGGRLRDEPEAGRRPHILLSIRDT